MDAIKYLQATDLSADPPEGFRLLPTGGGFNCLFGAVYGCVIEDRLVLGFRVSPRHLNPHNTCHGGVLATFADMMAYAAQWEAGLLYTLTPTISLSTDFLAPALLGNGFGAIRSLSKAPAQCFLPNRSFAPMKPQSCGAMRSTRLAPRRRTLPAS